MALADRIRYDERSNTLFVNLASLEITSEATIAAISEAVCRICAPLGHKVHAVIGYEGFGMESRLEEAYLRMVQDLTDRFCLGVTCFTARGFIRKRPGADASPHRSGGELHALLD